VIEDECNVLLVFQMLYNYIEILKNSLDDLKANSIQEKCMNLTTVTDLYLDGGYNFITNNFVMESISQRYFIEKVDSMIIGNSKLNMKKN